MLCVVITITAATRQSPNRVHHDDAVATKEAANPGGGAPDESRRAALELLVLPRQFTSWPRARTLRGRRLDQTRERTRSRTASTPARGCMTPRRKTSRCGTGDAATRRTTSMQRRSHDGYGEFLAGPQGARGQVRRLFTKSTTPTHPILATLPTRRRSTAELPRRLRYGAGGPPRRLA